MQNLPVAAGKIPRAALALIAACIVYYFYFLQESPSVPWW